MAKVNLPKKTPKATPTTPLDLGVRHVVQFDDDAIQFALDVRVGDRVITIYNCRIREANDVNFISFPSRKAKDGKYYSWAYIQLTREEQDQVIKMVCKELDG